MRRWALAMALVAIANGGGETQAQEPRISLSVKPVLCVTDKREDSCALSILVVWHSSRVGRYCLHNDLSDAPLQCWGLAETGTIVEERVVQETFSYWLTDGASTARLAEAALDVLTADSNDRRRHRPRRHVWDIL